MTKKITKKERFAQLLTIPAIANDADMVEFINHEIELLSNKNGSRAETKTQKENVVLKDRIHEVLATIGKPVTITELQESCPEMGAYTNQKLSALMTQMVRGGSVEKVMVKGKAYFSVVADPAE